MDVVVRPTNDGLLREVVFPAFELGAVDARAAIKHLLRFVRDESTSATLELALEATPKGPLVPTSERHWVRAVDRLLFLEWEKRSDGWYSCAIPPAYAGPWEESLHISLMLEDPFYPYAESHEADEARRKLWTKPDKRFGITAMMCGVWDPVPAFPPGQVLTPPGNALYKPSQNIARADWAWRPMLSVSEWAARLPGVLNGLLEREAERLKPVPMPEKHEILNFWLGRLREPPVLAVAFSGLGPRSMEWIREVGMLAHVVRDAAAKQQGMTAHFGRHIKMDFDRPYEM